MNNFFRGIIAAWGAKKLGGGCLSTIVIFVVIYMLLGKCITKAVRRSLSRNRRPFAADNPLYIIGIVSAKC